MAERTVTLTLGILQGPVLLAAKHLGDMAGEVHGQGAEHGAGNGAHARDADPAYLFVRRGAEVTVVEVVETRRPFGNPAAGLPLLHHFDKAAVAGGEVLRAQVQGAGIAALARHAPAAATALVEQLDFLSCGMQGLGGGQSGDAGADDGDGGGCAHGLPRVLEH
jgi:hypothetical protein